MTRLSVLVASGLLALAASSALAEEAVLSQLYGRGAHAYFAKDYVRAHQQFSAAIDGGSRDPRVYFFRGLAYQQLGRAKQADNDFEKAATLEAQDVNRYYNVSKALVRVQGDVRRTIERHRVDARVAALAEAQRIQKARYEAQRETDRAQLVSSAEAAPVQPVAPVAAGSSDPFATGPITSPPATEAPMISQPIALPTTGEAASTPPAPAPATAQADDPFDAPAPPQPAMQAEAPEQAPAPAAGSGKPRSGGLLGALGKAIGSAAGEANASGERAPTPVAPPSGTGPVDPFGGPAVPGATPGTADPFGGSVPAPAMPSNAPADPFSDPGTAKPKAREAADPFSVEPAAPKDDPFAN